MRTRYVPEDGGSEESRGLAVVVDIADCPVWVVHLVVHDGVDKDSNAVLGQDLGTRSVCRLPCQHLLWRDVVGLGSQVNLLILVHARNDEEDPRTSGPAIQHPPKSGNDCKYSPSDLIT